MRHAIEALHQANAQLTDEEKQETERCLAHIDNEVAEKMKVWGVDNIQVSTNNRAVAAAITAELVVKEWVPMWRGVNGGVGIDGQPRLIAYLLNIGPSQKAVVAAKTEETAS